MSKRDHYLLTALGTSSLGPATYELGSQRVESRAAPLALLQLLSPALRPNRVVVVLTRGAKENKWDEFRAEFDRCVADSNIVLEAPIEVPEGQSTDETQEILRRVAERFREPCELTVDVTHGFRHFPLIVYPLLLYLSSLRGNVKVVGAYYGMRLEESSVWPIVSIEPLLRLPEWFYAVRVFREYGVTEGVSKRLHALADQVRQALLQQGQDKLIAEEAGPLSKAANTLEHFGSFYGWGLPLELGRAARGLQPDSDRIRHRLADRVPLGEELFDLIEETLSQYAFDPDRVPGFKGEWKRQVRLDKEELERQARLIDRYLERRQLALGLSLLREWVISWVIWRRGETEQWLERDVRYPAERYLGAAKELVGRNAPKDVPVSDELRSLGTFWDSLTQLRNQVAHNGMTYEVVELDEEKLRSVQDFWRNRLRTGDFPLPALGGSGGTVLVTPQGQRKGVLFSALRTAKKLNHDVSRCIVICSEQSKNTLEEAASAAGFQGEIIPIALCDPFGGFDELPEITAQTKELILEADRILANLTGGTTLMGIVVQKLVEQAQGLARPTLRFALIDRRPVDQQASDPFVESEYYLIDERTESPDAS